MSPFASGAKRVFRRQRGQPGPDGQPYLGAVSLELQSADSDGDHWVEGSVELFNPTTDTFEEAEIDIVARDENGAPIESFEASGGPLPPGGQCVIKVSGFMSLRGRAVSALDIYPRVIDIERANVAIDVQWEA